MKNFTFTPIGIIRTPFKEPVGMPIQPCFAEGAEGTIEVFDEYIEGLADLEGFSYIHLIYVFHRSDGHRLMVTPFKDNRPRGVFSTRAPRRPNPVGLSVVRLTAIDGGVLHIRDVDILDETPMLDIKPFNPDIDNRLDCRVGWMERKFGPRTHGISDTRYVKKGDE